MNRQCEEGPGTLGHLLRCVQGSLDTHVLSVLPFLPSAPQPQWKWPLGQISEDKVLLAMKYLQQVSPLILHTPQVRLWVSNTCTPRSLPQGSSTSILELFTW